MSAKRMARRLLDLGEQIQRCIDGSFVVVDVSRKLIKMRPRHEHTMVRNHQTACQRPDTGFGLPHHQSWRMAAQQLHESRTLFFDVRGIVDNQNHAGIARLCEQPGQRITKRFALKAVELTTIVEDAQQPVALTNGVVEHETGLGATRKFAMRVEVGGDHRAPVSGKLGLAAVSNVTNRHGHGMALPHKRGLARSQKAAHGRLPTFFWSMPAVARVLTGCLLVVMPVAAQTADSDPIPLVAAGDSSRGRALALERTTSCVLCHLLPNVDGGLVGGNLGPSLEGVGARLSAAQLRYRLVDSSRLNPQTIMPAYFRVAASDRVAPEFVGRTILQAQEIEDLIAWLTSLR